jgi:hypothetical protein
MTLGNFSSNSEMFIFSWPGTEVNASKLEKFFAQNFETVRVIHSGHFKSNHFSPPSNWILLDDSCYFGEQFKKAVELFNGQVFIHIQADVRIDKIKISDFITSLENAFANNCGIWSADFSYTGWPTDLVSLGNEILNSPLSELINFKNVINTDCTCWAISSDVLDYFTKNVANYPHLGWGIDLTMCAIARHMNKFVVRDTSIFLNHKEGTGYSTNDADFEMKKLFLKLPINLRHDVIMTLEIAKLRRKVT